MEPDQHRQHGERLRAHRPGGGDKATLVTLADQQANGVSSTLPISGGKVTLEVTESPSIVLVDAM